MTTGSKENTISNCVLDTIYLTENSQVTIEDCTNFDDSKIKAINSEYKIKNKESNVPLTTEIQNVPSRSLFINRIYSFLSSINILRTRFKN